MRERIYRSLGVDNPSLNAYYFSSEEKIARVSAGEPIGNAPGPSWLKYLLGD